MYSFYGQNYETCFLPLAVAELSTLKNSSFLDHSVYMGAS